jgi:basic membrane protein A
MALSRVRFAAIGALLLLVPLVAACGGGSSGAGTPQLKTKVCLVTDIGGLNDKGFNHLADVGLNQAVSQLGVTPTVLESKSGDDYIPNLTSCATAGNDLVIGVGFLMQQAIGTVSGQFPNIQFAIVDGDGTDANFNNLHHANVTGLLFREQEAGALVGVIAGMLEKDGSTPKKSHAIGAVGGIAVPAVVRYIAGYKWAAKMEDPSTKVYVGYSNDFTDTTKCAGVANTQIGQGADVIFQVAGGCGLGALQAAGQNHVYSVGVDADQKDADPSVIASATKRVDVAVFDEINFIYCGLHSGAAHCPDAAPPRDSASGERLFTLANDGVGAAIGNITLPADVSTELASVTAKIKSGALVVPTDIPNPSTP